MLDWKQNWDVPDKPKLAPSFLEWEDTCYPQEHGFLGEICVATIFAREAGVFQTGVGDYFRGVVHLPGAQVVGEDGDDLESIRDQVDGEIEEWMNRAGVEFSIV